MNEFFLGWAASHGWNIELTAEKIALPSDISARYQNIPKEWLEFACSIRVCSNAADTAWFLTSGDYMRKNNDEWRYNEFELISLDAAQGEEDWIRKITEFWNEHLAIAVSVADEYEYYAIDMFDGSIARGCEPEFEKAETVAVSFGEFLKKIADGKITL